MAEFARILPIALADTGGNTLIYTYSTTASAAAPAAGYLTRVTDNTGRSIAFTYTLPSGGVAATDGLISTITNTVGQSIAIAYDANQNLSSITWPDAKEQSYVYENASLPWALTGFIDENASRYVTWGYNAQGRAIHSHAGSGVDSFDVSYTSPPGISLFQSSAGGVTTNTYNAVAPTGVTVTLANGQVITPGSTVVNGKTVTTGQSQPAGSGCSASTSYQTYDANGNIASTDDFKGMRSCMAYDAKNQEVTRVEGLANTVDCATVLPANASLPTDARRITTTYHPDWSLPATVTVPGAKSTTVYQGQPDPFNANTPANCTSAPVLPNGKVLPLVCKQVVQALLVNGTVDATVPNVVSTSTYDTFGRILTSTDTAGRTTSYAYYADSVMDGQSVPVDGQLTLMLLKGDGANGATTIVDSSPTHRTLSALGGATINTAQSKFGGASLSFDGSTGYVLVPASQDFNFGAGDFTIEKWLYKTANNANYSRLWNANGDVYDGVASGIDPSGNWGVWASVSGGGWEFSNAVIAPLANNQWYHLAIVRSGTNLTAYVNGAPTLITSALGATPLYFYPGDRVIGGQGAAPRMFAGYIDEFRILKGKAAYIGAFVPPSASFLPFPGYAPTATSTGHLAGDLKSITAPAVNGVSFTTTFDSYDALGRVKQMTDAKGIATTVNYSPRGWVTSISTTAPGQSARLTSYTYDNVGQLTGVLSPDGTSTTMTYDAAHRLVGASDAKGNSVTYTLDNMGNRIGEEIKDPSGVLQQQIQRSFDALNRVQQVKVGAP